MSHKNGTSDRIKALSLFIAQNATQVSELQLGSKPDLTSGELEKMTQAVSDACRELEALLTEPHEWLAQVAWGYMDSVALSIVLEMNIHRHIQAGDSQTSLAQLADITGGSIDLIKRIMRQCVKRSIFEEVEPELYRHNNRSMCLLHHEFASLMHYLVDDGLLCGAHLAQSTLENNLQIPSDRRLSAFQLAFQTDKTLYDYYHTVDQKRGRRFADAMAGHYNTPLDEPIETIFPFSTLNRNSLVVDVGGGNGQHSLRLAAKFPGMRFVVQDHTSVIQSAQGTVPAAIAGRIQWQLQDMYSPQQVKGADIYLLSHVLMDNTNDDCATVIRHITKAMKPGISKILVHDFVNPAKGEYASPFLNLLDLHMVASLNTFSRSYREWLQMFHSADPQLSLQRFCAGPKNSAVFEFLLNFRSHTD
ncbi:uncharacterized protein N7473_004261 [Penicillium subrubescens]|uniref:uncharacterized protein n=1 Tax=Penicillium subrubescens TaxID=1316194 RepID=UPI002544F777|nr:uncharacterized protein N7473_004261 [Penicillium subrubescens]KAJ5900191.1 hypothetical protein N7473_004261 [Penicillium subrubescens]